EPRLHGLVAGPGDQRGAVGVRRIRQLLAILLDAPEVVEQHPALLLVAHELERLHGGAVGELEIAGQVRRPAELAEHRDVARVDLQRLLILDDAARVIALLGQRPALVEQREQLLAELGGLVDLGLGRLVGRGLAVGGDRRGLVGVGLGLLVGRGLIAGRLRAGLARGVAIGGVADEHRAGDQEEGEESHGCRSLSAVPAIGPSGWPAGGPAGAISPAHLPRPPNFLAKPITNLATPPYGGRYRVAMADPRPEPPLPEPPEWPGLDDTGYVEGPEALPQGSGPGRRALRKLLGLRGGARGSSAGLGAPGPARGSADRQVLRRSARRRGLELELE